ncbi:MAG: hypothetical protein FGF50_11580 [Candidatus Brockarchaeota archaeon]|nr:hypothetical protein [Candidatus Brockarchaeota archaeon]
MVNPELRKRFVDSLDYLRKMDFFQDYSHLSSEEILEGIFGGEIDYKYWWEEWEKKPARKRGVVAKRSIEEQESLWMKSSNAGIDYYIIPFDTKRVIREDPETGAFSKEMGIAILARLARISRSAFQPTNVSSRWMVDPEYKWSVQEVNFDFKGRRHSIQIVLQHDYFMDIGLKELNEIIEDTGYQYYLLATEDIIIVVLTKEEVEKLMRERGWNFKYEVFSIPR